MLRFACPKCKQVLQAPETQGGQVLACPQCRTQLRVPIAVPSAASAAPSAPAPRPPASTPARGAPARVAPPDPTDGEPEWRPNLDERDEPSEALLRELPRKMTKELEDLGAPLFVFKVNTAPRILAYVFGILMILGGLFFGVLLVFVLALNRRAASPEAVQDVMLMVPFLLLGGPGLLAAGYFLYRRRIIVCQEGVAEIKPGGGADTCRWDQARSTFQSVTKIRLVNRYGWTMGIRIDKVYTLVRDDGLRMVFTNKRYADVDRFWHIIQRETTRLLTPAAFDAVTRERRVLSFADVGVGMDGVHAGADVLPWAQVGGLILTNGRAHIRFPGGGDFTSIAVDQIPNLHVFLNLTENLSGKRWR